MEGLGRVNLLVGTNNCGKTSILESVQLLCSPTPSVLNAVAARRGEWQAFTDGEHRSAYAIDTSQLFAWRDLTGEVRLTAIRCSQTNASDKTRDDEVRLCVGESTDEDSTGRRQAGLIPPGALPDDSPPLRLRLHRLATGEAIDVPITAGGLLLMRLPQFRRASDGDGTNDGAQFIGGRGMTAAGVSRLFDDVVLREGEDLVTHALRILEPRVERVAVAHGSRLLPDGPGGIFVKLRDVDDRVPIGSTGDGMWRMLGLALMLAKAKGGVLLVDEIDTGLHYTVMEDMWRMVCKQAAVLSVQVFATTHSRDCYESLAAVVKAEAEPTETVTIQRIEQNRQRAVAISGNAIVVAAERGLEVR